MLGRTYDNGVFDIEYPLSAIIDAHRGAWIADDGVVSEPTNRAGAAAK
jgi:hypothetical protein